MITITNTETFGFEAAFRGIRNSFDSWSESDSILCKGEKFEDCTVHPAAGCPRNGDFSKDLFCVGSKDMKLAANLVNRGDDEGKFLRMIHVQCDICAPLYLWKQLDTYKIGTVANSCSTMHRIHAKEFTMDDFSHDHLCELSKEDLGRTIETLNKCRELYLETKDKKYWWQLIQLLPSSYNQMRTWDTNYQVLRHIYNARKNHQLDEWHVFCEWIESLRYADQLLVTK